LQFAKRVNSAPRSRQHQLQRIIQHLARTLPGVAYFTWRLLQLTCQRIPVQFQVTLAFTAPDQDIETLYRHHQFQRLNPFDFHFHRVFLLQIIDLGLVLAGDGLQTLLFTGAIGLLFFAAGCRQFLQPFQRFPAQVVVILLEPFQISALASQHAFEKRLQT
jgi:hypothetical protein